MLIVPATAQDVPAITALVNRSYRGDSSRLGWTSEADLLDGMRINEQSIRDYINEAQSAILVCRQHQQLLGCVHLQVYLNQVQLGMLSVDPALQQQGTGKLLLAAGEAWAEAQGIYEIIITVISVRTTLIDWYKRKGYTYINQPKPFPDGEQFGKPRQALSFITMKKVLEVPG